MLVAVLLAVSAVSAPPNHQVIQLNPNAASVTMGRFWDDERRRFIEDARRDQMVAYRQSVIAHRVELADQLDRLIAAGDCDQARAVAQRAGDRDIREGVARVCDARAPRG